METVFAQVGRIDVGGTLPGIYQQTTGLGPFVSNVLRLVFAAAGVWAFIQLILGGLGFINAGGDSKAIEKAWYKIWQALLGLVIIVASFALISVVSLVLFGRGDAILNPEITGPGG